ncbi:MAG: BrnT family toxin [Snowella sp.]|nr:BrnT family toxin [Snowella sp.]
MKNEINQQKHGLSFEDAYLVFEGECVSFVDDRFAYSELRLITLGKLEGRMVVIVHTPRQNKTRIISQTIVNKKFIKSDLIKIDQMTDEDIDYSDIPELGDEFFTKTTVPFPRPYANPSISEDSDYFSLNKSLHQPK